MEWYWWILIVAGVIGVGALKIYFFGKIKNKSKNKSIIPEEDED